MAYSQRDGRWSGQRLGTVDGWTLGAYGCYVTSFAMVANHFGKGVNPSELDNIFTERGLYVDGGLCTDDMLSQVYPDIVYAGTYHCESFDCDLSVLEDFNVYEHEAILEVDFDHNPGNGLQTHFVRLNSYSPSTGMVVIDDPWTGETINFADRYGDPRKNIYKVVKYYGPAAPTPPSEPIPPAPVEGSSDHSTPVAQSELPPSDEQHEQSRPDPAQSDTPVDTAPVEPDVLGEQTPNTGSLVDEVGSSSDTPDQSNSSTPPIVPPRKEVTMVEKLKSRKLWVTVATVLLFALNGQWNEATATVLAFLGVQGYIDAKAGK